MPINFLYGRRESLHGKAEVYKKSVRTYLESLGFSQTTDSRIQGTFADMVFVNPHTDLGKKFLVESKAEEVSLKSKKLARELIEYFRLSQSISLQDEMKFKLFLQAVTKPEEWEKFFSENTNSQIVQDWCDWYNIKCLEEGEKELDESTIKKVSEFFAKTEVTIGPAVDLEQAALENQSVSGLSITKMAKALLGIVNRRNAPVFTKSKLVMNIIPITVPKCYFSFKTNTRNKEEIYARNGGEPPFIFTREREIFTFADLDHENPLSDYVKGEIATHNTKELQDLNPRFSSDLVNIHIRRIFWKRGIYRDKFVNVYYFPILDTSKDRLEISNEKGKSRWVVKKIIRKKDTPYHKKGETNFFFHRGVELKTPTYWGNSYVELIPRRYYTLDGATIIDGKIRDRIDRNFRNPNFDRSGTRLSLMRYWRYLLFESPYVKPYEKWFEKFQFGSFVSKEVGWSPSVIGRNQMSIWEYNGDDL